MPRLNYYGPDPATPTEVLNRGQGTVLITGSTTNRPGASAAVEAAAANLADKDYIDLADANYVTVDYYQGQDQFNVPVAKIGQPNGVAGLTGGKIPSAQIPTLGQGYFKGPFGPTAINPVSSATTTPVKIADFAIGVQSVTFQPLAYASLALDTKPGGRPIVEMRISNGPAAYGFQTLIAQGIGRPIYDGRQVITVVPASSSLGASVPTPWPGTSTDITVGLWVYSSSSVPVTITNTSVLSASVFLIRMVA
jgi:hypothetical protein